MSHAVEVRVPDLGGASGVKVIEWLVAVGDTVALEQPLLTLESEKATMDVPSPVAGKVLALHLATGADAGQGTLVATVEAADVPAQPAVVTSSPATPALLAAAPAPPSPATPTRLPVLPAPAAVAPTPSPVFSAASLPTIDEATFSKAHASPSVRRFARELGVDLGRVRGSGVKARITHDDVKSWVKQVLSGAAAATSASWPRVPTVDFAKFGPVRVQPLTRIQRISGPRLHASWVNLPHVTQFEQADITALEAMRHELQGTAAAQGVKLTPLAFVIRACARVIAQYPKFASSLDSTGENLVYKQYLHIGFAADTPGGLVVPVIREADRKDVYALARELAELSAKARAGQLKVTDMQGGCFTISSLGGIGGTLFTPIINAPEVAILGVSKSAHQPHWDGAQFVPRLMLPLSLSYDHRVIDGADGARFTTALAAQLADVAGLLEAVP
jgi:pyruvate dehydrogenase E2 component (dihydrolipoamide acetyltransferase)